MKYKKPSIIKHITITIILLFIGFIDHIYINLFPTSYHPFASLLMIVIAIGCFIYLSHKWFYIPYRNVLDKVDKYYEDMIDAIAIVEESTNSLPTGEEANDLEDLIDLYKSAQKRQLELVCQLTNTNNVLDQNNKFANAIVQITSEILHSGDIRSILQLILNKAIEIIPNAQKGSILLCSGDYLEYKAMYGYDIEALKDFKFSFNEIFQYNAEDMYEPIIISDVEQFNKKLHKDKFDILKGTRSFELNSSISCAISVDNQFYGTINIDNTESNYAFVEEHKPIIKYFAEQIGVALKNAQLLEKILYMSQYDTLTNTCNRAYFEEQLNALHKEYVQKKQSFTIVLLDMNDLKLTNDTFGHETGDKLIITVTDYISNMEPKPSLFGRVGGDEFALVFKDRAKQEVQQIMQSIREHFNKTPFKHNDLEILNISFGYGMSTFPDEGEDLTTLYKNADYLMYIDKRRSKDGIL